MLGVILIVTLIVGVILIVGVGLGVLLGKGQSVLTVGEGVTVGVGL